MEWNKLDSLSLKRVEQQVRNFNKKLDRNQASREAVGKNEFLKILTVQLSHQNPLQPMDNTQFISQMAQFTSLEQMQNINQTLTELKGDFSEIKGSGLVGKRVTYTDIDGSLKEGIIEEIKLKDQKKVVIDGAEVSIDEINSIRQKEKTISNNIDNYKKNIKQIK